MANAFTLGLYLILLGLIYPIIYVGLSYITMFLQNDLYGVTMGKERGDKFKDTIIANFSDLFRCSLVVGEKSNLSGLFFTALVLIVAQGITFIIAMVALFSNDPKSKPPTPFEFKVKIGVAVVVFVLFMVMMTPLAVLMSKLTKENRVRVTDNTRDYECVTFKSQSNKKVFLDTMYMTWASVVVQSLALVVAGIRLLD
jgi:magnesium-transporting ATPase (P-type)